MYVSRARSVARAWIRRLVGYSLAALVVPISTSAGSPRAAHAADLDEREACAATEDDGGGDDDGGACGAWVEKYSDPQFHNITAQIDGAGAYNGVNLPVPRAVPLGLSVVDQDTLLLRCLRDCKERTVGGYWTAQWTLPAGGADCGYFIASNGAGVTTIADAQHVVYMPPRDVSCGSSRSFVLQARIYDPGPDPALGDAERTVTFTVVVRRRTVAAASFFEVDITFAPPNVAASAPVCSPSTGTCCTYGGSVAFVASPITATIQSAPTTMLVNQERAIVLQAKDIDQVVFDCGVLPCSPVSALDTFSDGLTYVWQVVSGPGVIMQQGRTAVLRSTGNPGRIALMVTIDDCTGFCADDPPITLTLNVDSYRLDFIDASNNALPRLGTATTSNEGLRVSQVVTNLANSMNGCGGPAATFDGPIPNLPNTPPDPRTYRVEGEKPAAVNGAAFTIRVRTAHAWGNEYEGVGEYDHTFATILGAGANANTFRSDLHTRLVSNVAPAANAQAGGVYDDDVCGFQSIYAKPGDWVTATLIANGMEAGSIELPVERPWSEAQLPAGSPVSIATGSLLWFANAGTAGAGAAQFHARRLIEDFAQAGIRANVQQSFDAGPYKNALWLRTAGVHAPAAGIVSIRMEAAGGWLGVADAQINATMTFAQVATAIEVAIGSVAGFTATAYFEPLSEPNDQPYYIVVNPKTDVTFQGIDVGTTGLQLISAPLNYTDNLLTRQEMTVLGLNLKPVIGAVQATTDTVVVTAAWTGHFQNPGSTFVPLSSPVASLPGLAYTTFLGRTSGDADDATHAQVSSHEYGHFFQNGGVHPANPELLMAGSAPFPPMFDPAEAPQNIRRLTTAEINTCRATSIPQFLKLECVPIPARKK